MLSKGMQEPERGGGEGRRLRDPRRACSGLLRTSAPVTHPRTPGIPGREGLERLASANKSRRPIFLLVDPRVFRVVCPRGWRSQVKERPVGKSGGGWWDCTWALVPPFLQLHGDQRARKGNAEASSSASVANSCLSIATGDFGCFLATCPIFPAYLDSPAPRRVSGWNLLKSWKASWLLREDRSQR